MKPILRALVPLLLAACGDAGPAGTGDPTGTTGDAATGTTAPTTGTTGLMGALVDLIDPEAWQPLAAADDPFAAHRPPTIDCPPGLGYFVEAGGLEVDTASCNYAGFVQPSLHPVAAGAALKLNLYHFDLLAAEPATAHLAVMIGDHLIFEQQIAIPGPANVFDTELVADFDAPAGTPIVFHLHNHGQNTWTFASLQAEVASP